MHYVYLMESTTMPDTRYVGYTEELRQRMDDHNAGRNVSTAARRPWRIVTYLACSSKKQALAFESDLKSGSGHAFANKRLWEPIIETDHFPPVAEKTPNLGRPVESASLGFHHSRRDTIMRGCERF